MYRGSDSVFRLSLAGIAFIFIFFLLLVFVRAVGNELRQGADDPIRAENVTQDPRAEEIIRTLQKRELTLKGDVERLNTRLAGLSEAEKMLVQASKNPVLNGTTPESLLSVLELRAQLAKKLAPASGSSTIDDNEIASRALSAIEFKKNIETLIERELGQSLVPGQEITWEQWIVDSILLKPTVGASASPRFQVGEENSTLRAQAALLRARLGTHDDPFLAPCWFNDKAQVDPLLNVNISTSGNITVVPAWSPAREAAATAIPGINRLLAGGRMQTWNQFIENAKPVARHSGGQCHYAIRIADRLNSGKRSEQMHQQLESLFYLDFPR